MRGKREKRWRQRGLRDKGGKMDKVAITLGVSLAELKDSPNPTAHIVLNFFLSNWLAECSSQQVCVTTAPWKGY